MTMKLHARRRQLRPARYAIDVAVEGLHHAENELTHALTPPYGCPIGSRSECTGISPGAPPRELRSFSRLSVAAIRQTGGASKPAATASYSSASSWAHKRSSALGEACCSQSFTCAG